MTSSFIAQPQMSYADFQKIVADIANKGIRARFKRPLIVGDESGPIYFSIGDQPLISFIGAEDLSLTNLRISWDIREDAVILERWRDKDPEILI